MEAIRPEPHQRSGEPHAVLSFASLGEPSRCAAQVLMLSIHPRQPMLLGWSMESRPGVILLSERQEVRGVLLPNRIGFATRCQLLQRILADRLQHRDARLAS